MAPMPKKENYNKHFGAREAFKEHQKQDRPKQTFVRLRDKGMYAIGRELSGIWLHSLSRFYF